MRVALAVTLIALVGPALSGCATRDPERVARDQLQAFVEGDLTGFRSYFAPDSAPRVGEAMQAANRLAMQWGDSSGRPDRTNPFEIAASRAVTGDLVAMVVTSKRNEGDRFEMDVRITYPEDSTLTYHASRQLVSEATGVPFEDVDHILLDSFSVVHQDAPPEILDQLGARHRILMTLAYRSTPEQFQRVLDGKYVMQRRRGQWEVLREPLTESLLSEGEP